MKNILFKLAICMLLLLTVIFILFTYTTPNRNIELDAGWSVNYNGTLTTPKSLVNANITIANKGDILYIYKVLPSDLTERSTICLKSYHCVVSAFINNEQFFSYGEEYRDNNSLAGDGYYYIQLPDNCAGKLLSIKFEACDDNAFTFSTVIELVPSSEYVFTHIKSHLLESVIPVFVFTIGIILFMFPLINGKFDGRYRKILWLGFAFILLSLWVACYYGGIHIVVTDNHTVAYIEHLSLYFILVPLIAFYLEDAEDNFSKKALKIILLVEFCFCFIAVLCEVFKVVHLNAFLPFFHVFGFFSCGIIVLTYTRTKSENKGIHKITLFGISALAISFLGELIYYRIAKTMTLPFVIPTVPIGLFIFATSEVIAYIYYLVFYSKKHVHDELLTYLANIDPLTKLYNRNACEKKLGEIDALSIMNYSIINFDLNWLKRVNDTYGHTAGDEYIISFANLLKKHFSDFGTVGRMGGDEFIAITETSDDELIDYILEKMLTDSKTFGNKEYLNGEIFYAYGYCSSTSMLPLPTHTTFEKADERMYACKKQQKAAR